MRVEVSALQSVALMTFVGKAEGEELRVESGLSLRGKGTVLTSETLLPIVDEEGERPPS